MKILLLYNYNVAVEEGLKINVTESVPRLAVKQKNRANPPVSNSCDYYCMTVFFPFIDYVLSLLSVQELPWYSKFLMFFSSKIFRLYLFW